MSEEEEKKREEHGPKCRAVEGTPYYFCECDDEPPVEKVNDDEKE